MRRDAQRAATRARGPGHFQLEAAIQSAHARRAATGHTDWDAIALLYEGLLVWLAGLASQGFVRPEALAELKVVRNMDEVLDAIERFG